LNDGELFQDIGATYTFGTANPVSFAELVYPSQNGYFRSVTVNNQSSRLCAIYGNQSGAGTAICTVPPGTFLTQPVDSCEFISFRFFASLGAVDSGSIYVHACNVALSASSGVSAVAGGAGIVFDYSSFDTGAAFSS
jgi:hypothetical protein